MPVFRPEALRSQDRLHGDVQLVPPVSWQIVGYFLLASVATTAFFLSLASYGRVTVVTGRLTGDKGILRAVPSRNGTVDEIFVGEGQSVVAGTPLARVRIATPVGTSTLEQRREGALASRNAILADRAPDLVADADARIAGLKAQIAADQMQAGETASQIAQERQLLVSAQTDSDKARTIASRGFLSAHELLQRQDKLAERRQELSRLEQNLSAAGAKIASEQADVAQARTDLALRMSQLANDRAELVRTAADDDNASTLLITATGPGIVTGITAHPGDAAQPGVPLLSIVPAGTQLEATLDVPADAAGLVEPGEPIRIAVDAFPYQTFGTIEARLLTMSRATIPVLGDDGRTKDVFLVSAPLAHTTISAYGRRQPLRPGMTVSARIETGKRSLIGWLFDPILAVARR